MTSTRGFAACSIRILDSFSPGNSPAKVTLDDVEFGGDAALTMEIGGVLPGAEYDELVIGGTAKLGGELNVTLVGTAKLYTLHALAITSICSGEDCLAAIFL